MYYPIEDHYIHSRCPECGEIMAFSEAWAETYDLVVIPVECQKCKYSDIIMIHPLRQPAAPETEIDPANRYHVSQFDSDTWMVVDKRTNREVCVCSNYEGGVNARARATWIAEALNRCYCSTHW